MAASSTAARASVTTGCSYTGLRGGRRLSFAPAVSASRNGANRRPARFGKIFGGRGVVRAHAVAEEEEAIDRSHCVALKDEIPASAFDAVDLRVGYVSEAQTVDVEVEVRRGDKVRMRKKQLLKMKIDIGGEDRVIVADIVQVMDAESAVGKKLMVVANLPPEDVAGHKSHGRVVIGSNYDPEPMPRTFREILPGTGRLPPGSTYGVV